MTKRDCECRLKYLICFLLTNQTISRCLYDKRISQEVSGEDLGDEFAGYVSLISYFTSSRAHHFCT
jgi:hypothetical protein